ncbi:MAG TPA: [protein-PII] uridylyltransferase [Geminicoccus sp.]|uniref:[protein-PII] uridylyltransferase n=1 Tax=Geminicoccus sp. TaxID=2024832 RepID=UPI002E31E812|nr:[protein-PII] uridylyltransferase [Geminicoccus sp.]HEX2526273.1 [protein-PII] uridylyltransferase [Geminicoccus sp.]
MPTADEIRSAVRALVPKGIKDFPGLLSGLKRIHQCARQTIRERFEAGGSADDTVAALSAVMDGLIQGILDLASDHLYPAPNPSKAEEFAVLAVGGYGRSELCPNSDIDLLFLVPYKRTPLAEQMAEFLLYRLWDLGLKVGHATRSIPECLKLAQQDLSVSTALLESRPLWGDERTARDLRDRYRKDVVQGHEAAFIEAKLAERDERHQRVGDSRYLLEPNIKEGKGGLRDLHTLGWLVRFVYGTSDLSALLQGGLLARRDLASFKRSKTFLLAVRCHLHWLSGRTEDRLTVDVQPEIAQRMGFRARIRSKGVERFMKRYYLAAREVGNLTRVVCSTLEEQHRRRPKFALPRFGLTRKRVDGFVIQGNRLVVEDPKLFQREPIRILQLFQIADARELDIHPSTISALSHALTRIDARLREDPHANRLFLDILTSRKDPAGALGRMNDAGVLGRFVPDFGRIVAQMQHNLYHVYTTDEHTIRAIDILRQIEDGKLAADLPLATELIPKLLSRRALFVALFLHDIGKGRGGRHAEVGAMIAAALCPRFGLEPEEAETVVWLVRNHLLMSDTAFRRDLEDPKTIQDFVEVVQSPERLKLLLVMTVCDIRAVGPTVWNGWKGQLLRELHHEAEAALQSGDPRGRRGIRVNQAKSELEKALLASPDGWWTRERIDRHIARHDPRYWLGFTTEELIRHAELIRRTESQSMPIGIDFRVDKFRARSELLLYAPDHPGLFMKVAGAIALGGASIVDAHIFTTTDGTALDTLGFQDADRQMAVDDPERFERIRSNLIKTLSGEIWLEKALAGRRTLPARADVFRVEPRVLIDNNASRTHTVIEVNGRDRPGLLFDLAKALMESGLVISSAHISTYGERVVDVFYVKDVFGMKVTVRSKTLKVHKLLTEALSLT